MMPPAQALAHREALGLILDSLGSWLWGLLLVAFVLAFAWSRRAR